MRRIEKNKYGSIIYDNGPLDMTMTYYDEHGQQPRTREEGRKLLKKFRDEQQRLREEFVEWVGNSDEAELFDRVKNELWNIGINVYNTDGTIKDTYSILKEVVEWRRRCEAIGENIDC